MRILVCVKPVPDPEKYQDLRIDPDTKRLVREGVPAVVNPTDRNALELALQLRQAFGGTVTVLSMAPASAKDKMTECLAMGADAAYLLSDRAFGGADTYATSYVLAEGVKKIAREDLEDDADGRGGFDLILAGHESADGATSHVPTQLAEWLGLPHVCRVRSLSWEAPEDPAGAQAEELPVLQAVRRSETEDLCFEVRLPAVVAVTREINKPRLVSAMGIIKARKKPLTIWGKEDLAPDEGKIGLDGSPTKAGRLITPDMSRASVSLGDDAAAAADQILAIIEKAGA